MKTKYIENELNVDSTLHVPTGHTKCLLKHMIHKYTLKCFKF